jgi:hypothetical protein
MCWVSLKLHEVSLAPHFSEVVTRESLLGNRFNGFYWKAVKTADKSSRGF